MTDPAPVHPERFSTTGVTTRKLGVVLHTSESGDGSYAALRNAVTRPGDRKLMNADRTWSGRMYGSAYHVLTRNDPGRTFDQLLPATAGPYSAPPLNKTWWHLCIPGRARQTHDEWLDAESIAGIHAAARFVVARSVIDGFPLARVGAGALRTSTGTGYCDHWTVSRAFPAKTDHTDVGPEFPWDLFGDLLEFYSTPTTPEDDDMHREIWQPQGSNAVFLALVDQHGVAISCRWSGPGTDRVIGALRAHVRHGAVVKVSPELADVLDADTNRPLERPSLDDLLNVWLDGPLPTGDIGVSWHAGMFAG